MATNKSGSGGYKKINKARKEGKAPKATGRAPKYQSGSRSGAMPGYVDPFA